MKAFVVLEPAAVAEVLREAPSVRKAVFRLGTSETRLRKFCRENAALYPLYIAVTDRGTAKATAARRLFRYGV